MKYTFEIMKEYEDAFRGISVYSVSEDKKLMVDFVALEELEDAQKEIDEAYQRGLEVGKAQSERGCDGCRFDGTRCTACENCCNSHMNHWTAKDDEINVGDEVRAEDGTAVFVVTWMSENCICGVYLEGKCYSYEPREVCGKTGRKYSVGISDITRCTDDED